MTPGIARSFAALLGLALAAQLARARPGWHDAPAYLDLFAPVPSRAAYAVSISPDELPVVLADLQEESTLVRTPGSWTARVEHPFDAFGRSGRYNRWRLARLYGARQPRVARGARVGAGRVVEAWTLVSPYPDPGLTRLEPGTLRIVQRFE